MNLFVFLFRNVYKKKKHFNFFILSIKTQYLEKILYKSFYTAKRSPSHHRKSRKSNSSFSVGL